MSEIARPGRVTIADVAKSAGVSLSTVDRVLNGRAPVRLDTAKHIHEVAAKLGFHLTPIIKERVQGKKIKYKLGFLLEQPDSAFYTDLGAALSQSTSLFKDDCESAVVEFMQDLSPDAVSLRLRGLGERVDAVAIVAADHTLISSEIDRLKKRGVPVFALISDLSTPLRAGYAGLDNRSVGRTAAWLITGLAQQTGKIAIFVGSHRFQCQELAEMSFRSYVREHAPDFELMEPLVTLESNELAEEGTRELLHRHPDIVGVFVAGGGSEGVLNALREDRLENPGHRPIGIAREFTARIRQGLISRDLHATLSHPLPQLAQDLVAMMVQVLSNESQGLQQAIVPLAIQTPENV